MKHKVCLVAGGAGFVGVNLISKLLDQGANVFVGDNLSLGSYENVHNYTKLPHQNCIEIDLSCSDASDKFFELALHKYGRVDEVWHLAANSDIPAGVDNPDIDLKDTFMTTYNLLKSSKKYSVKKFNFASSSAVYGDWKEIALDESLGPLKPISYYGAMKLASEAQISAAAESFLDKANIFRFPNVVGIPATHGVILDFFLKLKKNPKNLSVLGDGTQRKSYLHITELVDAMFHVSSLDLKQKHIEIVNIGCNDSGIYVKEIAEIVRDIASPSASISYGNEKRGWLGDIPRFSYNTNRLKSLGWEPKLSSTEAVMLAAKEIYKTQFE